VSKKLFYRIGEACKQLDIQPYVLRYWETEFPVLSPRKSKAGQRVYSEEELGLIQRIKQLLYEEGYTIAGAKKKLDAELAGDVPPPSSEPPRASAPAAGSRATAGSRARGGRAAGDTVVAVPHVEGHANSAPAAVVDEQEGSEEAPSSRGAVAAQPAVSLDSASGEQVERLRTGLREALAEARDILRLLSA
jgi:DNA-binding transcriptional MerR regulator